MRLIMKRLFIFALLGVNAHAMQNQSQSQVPVHVQSGLGQVQWISTDEMNKYSQRNPDGSEMCCWRNKISKQVYGWHINNDCQTLLFVDAQMAYAHLKAIYAFQLAYEKQQNLSANLSEVQTQEGKSVEPNTKKE